jgi:peptide/nickel transport system substrate-binding protein
MMKKLVSSVAFAALALGVAPLAAQELRVAVATHVPGLDPQQDSGNAATQFQYLIYDTLIERVPDSRPLEFRPGLATSWEQVEPTVWELQLREGVEMHDGTIMDADDVAFSLNRMFRLERPEYSTPFGRFFYNFREVEVVDALTVRIHTHREEPLFQTLISSQNGAIVSQEHHEALGFDAARIDPAGSGPYRVAQFTPRELLVLERFDGHWGDPAPLERINFQLVSEVASRVTGLINDEFDLITNIPPDQASAMDVEGVDTLGVTWPLFHVWVIQMNSGPTQDPLVRQAMRLCTDRQALVDGLWSGLGKVPNAFQFEEYGEPFYQPDVEHIRYDPEEARARLAQSDYNGEPIIAQFTQSYYLYGDLAAQVIQQQWAECGLNLQLQQIEQYDNDVLHIRAWSNPMYYPDPMGAMDASWSEYSTITRLGLWDPQHPEWDEVYDAARFGTDQDARIEAYRRLMELTDEESGWIVLYQPHELYGMRNGLSFEIPQALRAYTLPFRAGEVSFASN